MNITQHLFGYVFNPFEPVNLRIDESALTDKYNVSQTFIKLAWPPNNIYGAILYQFYTENNFTLIDKWIDICNRFNLRENGDTKTWAKAVTTFKGYVLERDNSIREVLIAFDKVIAKTGNVDLKFIDTAIKTTLSNSKGTKGAKLGNVFIVQIQKVWEKLSIPTRRLLIQVIDLITEFTPEWIKKASKRLF